jgi:hypothetical protein
VISTTHQTYYYLGDGLNGTGTVLMGLSLADGSEVCRSSVKAIGEIGIVGGGCVWPVYPLPMTPVSSIRLFVYPSACLPAFLV